jgi:hypothetical protein
LRVGQEGREGRSSLPEIIESQQGPKHLVSYFALVDADHILLIDHKHAQSWLPTGKGFVVDEVFGPSQANPSHFTEPHSSDDAAAFDPESATASGKTDLHLRYTCVRDP